MKIRETLISFMGLAAAAGAHAQSSVTLYGVIDNGLVYQNSGTTLGSTSGGQSSVKMMNGAFAGSRFGMKGVEDLGGGTKAIFQLESGFNSANGNSSSAGGIFTRLALVGLTDSKYGTLTAGRQYTAYYLLLAPYGPTSWLTGYFGAHPGDIDSLDTGYRSNNSFVYKSPQLYGFTFAASYALGGVPGSMNSGSAWSAGLQYVNGPLGVAAALQRLNNSAPGGGPTGANTSTSGGWSSINNGYAYAQAQQRVAVTAGYQFSPAWDVTASYSNVQYIPGTNSMFQNTATFNSAGAVLHFKPAAMWDLAAGYAYTRATQSNGITKAAQYHQFTLSQYFSLSKRTGLYAAEAYQHASGQTLENGQIVTATASIGDGFNGSPSSTRSQIGVGIGLIHRF